VRARKGAPEKGAKNLRGGVGVSAKWQSRKMHQHDRNKVKEELLGRRVRLKGEFRLSSQFFIKILGGTSGHTCVLEWPHRRYHRELEDCLAFTLRDFPRPGQATKNISLPSARRTYTDLRQQTLGYFNEKSTNFSVDGAKMRGRGLVRW